MATVSGTARKQRPDPEMAGFTPLGFGDRGEIPGGLGSGCAMTAVTAENSAILDGKFSAFVEDERFQDDMVELDDLAGDVEPTALTADVAIRIPGAFEHGDLLGAGEFTTSVHQAASI